MAIAVRPADLNADRELIIGFLSNYLTPLSNAARFDWLYLRNPHGQARAWVAIDAVSGLAVGMAAAFPRRVRVDGTEKVVWILGDFCIHDQHRSLGPALLLQRACLAEVDAGGAEFCYDLPSASMMAVYRRMHISPITRMIRLARPLRIDRKIQAFVKVPKLAQSLSTLGNFIIGLRCRNFKHPACRISLHAGRCGEEFSALPQQGGGQKGLCIERSSEYLNWRYLDNPLNHFELLTAHSADRLVGYAVFEGDRDDPTLVDLFGIDDDVVAWLVRATISIVWTRGAITLSAPMGEWHPSLPLMSRLGFQPRETSPVVVYGPEIMKEPIKRLRPWLLMNGDRDS